MPPCAVRVASAAVRCRVGPAAAFRRRHSLGKRAITTTSLSYAEGPSEGPATWLHPWAPPRRNEALTSLQPPLLHDTIPEHFARIVSQYGDRPAVMVRSPVPTEPLASDPSHLRQASTQVTTYADLDEQSSRIAYSLHSLGVRKGDRVAVSLGNVMENAVLTYAVAKLGAVLVPLNPSFNQKQLTAALQHLGVKVLIVAAVTDLAYKPCRGRSNLPLLEALVADLHGRRVESVAVPSLEHVVVVDNTRHHHAEAAWAVDSYRSLVPFHTLTAEAPATAAARLLGATALAASDTINIQFTSGTTSLPKAAMLSHTNILNNGRLIADRMGLTPADRLVVPPPLFHCFGCVLGYMATATTGAALLLPSPAFDPAAALRMAAEREATGLYGVATMFVAELALLVDPAWRAAAGVDPARLRRHLRKGIAAGSSVPASLMRRLEAELGLADLLICYGQTETSPVSLMTAPGDPPDRRAASVGRPLPHTRVKIVDPADRARVLPRGARGELAVAGYLVMRGYYGDAARTGADRVVDAATGAAWMHSGDEARMDAAGYVEITGRIKDLIIRGGENVSPLEVEDCLFRCPGVREVAVVGVPDDRYGEVVGAFVVPAAGWRVEADGESDAAAGQGKTAREAGEAGENRVLRRDDLRAWVREHLSAHLAPRYLWFVDAYPKTASGKIQKFQLRERAAADVKAGKAI